MSTNAQLLTAASADLGACAVARPGFGTITTITTIITITTPHGEASG